MRVGLLALLCCGATLICGVLPAEADVFGPISLVSDSSSEQAGYAHDAALSGNGQYLVFDGVFAGKSGVWRRDLASGSVEKVAGGDAELPSISDNGRFVSFTTTVALAPVADTNIAPDVYVRDMDLGEARQSEGACEAEEIAQGATPAPAGACPYTLVSAADGKAHGLEYEDESNRYGSVASGRTAISADGQHVAFVTTAVSNLVNPLRLETPVMQVAVRDLQTRTTQLVSVRDAPSTGEPAIDPETGGPEPVTGGEEGFTGAVYSEAGAMPPIFRGSPGYGPTPPLGASISADGTTVAWMAINVAEQAKVLPDEAKLVSRYTEPLWRRIADGTQAPTRRITGGSDPESPQCQSSGEAQLPETRSNPCQGPFYVGVGAETEPGIWKGGQENFIPELSADGYTVAFLAQAPTLTRQEGFASGLENPDLYVADMHGGLTRTEALGTLTALASGDGADLATTGSIVDFGLSPDGSQVAFSTQRTQFALNIPAYVSTPMAVPGMSELFDVDRDDETLTRVTQSYEGGPGEYPHQEVGSGTSPYGLGDGALSPSFSDDGNLLAFSSTAANLIYGDGNTPVLVEGRLERSVFDGSDAFLVGRIPFTPTPTETYVSAPPSPPTPKPEWRLGVTGAALSNGQIRLYVTVPGAGRLSASAKSVVRVSRTVRPAARRRRARAHKVSLRATKLVAATSRTLGPGGSMTQLTLTLSAPYRTLADAKAGLASSVVVRFAAPGHPTLSQTLSISFKRKVKAVKKRAPARRGRKR